MLFWSRRLPVCSICTAVLVLFDCYFQLLFRSGVYPFVLYVLPSLYYLTLLFSVVVLVQLLPVCSICMAFLVLFDCYFQLLFWSGVYPFVLYVTPSLYYLTVIFSCCFGPASTRLFYMYHPPCTICLLFSVAVPVRRLPVCSICIALLVLFDPVISVVVLVRRLPVCSICMVLLVLFDYYFQLLLWSGVYPFVLYVMPSLYYLTLLFLVVVLVRRLPVCSEVQQSWTESVDHRRHTTG